VERGTLFEECRALVDRVRTPGKKVRLALMAAFYLAISGEFEQAEVNLLSCLGQQATIDEDEYLQVLANRAMAQLGLCSFSRGDYAKACYYLTELCGSGKLRDLLSQGSRMIDGRLRKKLIPYYMYLPV
jgi:hypothetical protein